MKSPVVCDVVLWMSICRLWHFGGTYGLYLQDQFSWTWCCVKWYVSLSGSFLNLSLALKMKVASPSEMFEVVYQLARHHIIEDCSLCVNLPKTYNWLWTRYSQLQSVFSGLLEHVLNRPRMDPTPRCRYSKLKYSICANSACIFACSSEST